MIILTRLLFIAIALYLFLNFFLDDYNNKNNIFINKIYLFLFVFIVYFLFQFFTSLFSTNEITINVLIETSINNAILAIIAFDINDNLLQNNYFTNFSNHQKILMLILLIVGFMTVIKLLQLLISNN